MCGSFEENILKKLEASDDEKERVQEAVDRLFKELEKRTGDEEISIEIKLAGSVAKGTFLSDPDIDMFLLFPPSISREKMTSIGLQIGRDILEKTEEKYAEHPYINGIFKSFETDIVPCYEVKDAEDMISSVDRTPLHTDYIIEHLSETDKREVKLLKGFLQGIGCYGAKAEVKGFSGYLCELLVHRYGSFREVLKNAPEWKMGQHVNEIETSKEFEDALVFVDPVDPNRNVASALSEDKFYLFMYASKRYLEEKKETFFFPDPVPEKDREELEKILTSRGTDILVVSFPRPDIVEDNLYPQVQKALNALETQFKRFDFDLLHSDHFVEEDHIYLLYELVDSTLPNIEKHLGPPIWSGHTSQFREKYGEEVYIEKERLMVDRERRYKKAGEMVKKRGKDIGLGSDIDPFIPEEMKISEREEVLSIPNRVISSFLDRRFPWVR